MNRLILLVSLFLPMGAFALGWEQTAYLTLSDSAAVVFVPFAATQEQESRRMMVYSSKVSVAHQFCVPHMPTQDTSPKLMCGVSESTKATRIYEAAVKSKKLDTEAKRIFGRYQKGKSSCAAGYYAGYLYCTSGCEKDETKLLVKVEFAECPNE